SRSSRSVGAPRPALRERENRVQSAGTIPAAFEASQSADVERHRRGRNGVVNLLAERDFVLPQARLVGVAKIPPKLRAADHLHVDAAEAFAAVFVMGSFAERDCGGEEWQHGELRVAIGGLPSPRPPGDCAGWVRLLLIPHISLGGAKMANASRLGERGS